MMATRLHKKDLGAEDLLVAKIEVYLGSEEVEPASCYSDRFMVIISLHLRPDHRVGGSESGCFLVYVIRILLSKLILTSGDGAVAL